jgi:hypothetical protein
MTTWLNIPPLRKSHFSGEFIESKIQKRVNCLQSDKPEPSFDNHCTPLLSFFYAEREKLKIVYHTVPCNRLIPTTGCNSKLKLISTEKIHNLK